MRHHHHAIGLGPIHDLPTAGALVVIAVLPFAVWYLKRRIDRWEDGWRRENARRCAIDVAITLARSIQLCEDLRVALQASARVSDETLEAAIESLELSRLTLRAYLKRHIPLHELIPLASVAELRLGQGREAMAALQTSHPTAGSETDDAYAGRLAKTRAELATVVERLRHLQPDLGRAIAKVDAGWALPD